LKMTIFNPFILSHMHVASQQAYPLCAGLTR
jgi:hypothetical protein